MSKKRYPHDDKINFSALQADLRSRVDAEIRFDKGSKAMYSTDASNYRQVPVGVVVPRTRDAVVETVSVCRKHGVPILSRGGGTSLAGQCCNIGLVMDHSKYLNHILEIDPDERIARVEPGTILDHLRSEAEKKYQLTFGPDPATHNHCTLGGMIGNNSCGIHSVIAGRTVDNVEELEIVTYDGLRTRVGKTSEQELDQIVAGNGRRAQIYKGLRDIRDRYANLIREKYPKIPRRVSGYSLDELLPENGFNVARALVGSESTCVTVLEATVRLVNSPPYRTLLVLGYPDVYSAGDHVTEIMEYRPIGLEGIDHLLVKYMKLKNLHPKDAELLPEGRGWLLVEFGGHSKEEADEQAKNAMNMLKREKNPPSMKLFTDKKEEATVWEIRESGLGATANVPGEPLFWPGWEDAAVEPSKLGGYLRDFRDLLKKYKYECSLYGHFGQACVHCRIPFDIITHAGIQDYLSFIDEAADLVVRYGGSLSGEHGDGQSRAKLLNKMYGPELIDAFREFKEIWDPEWKMNPGKKIDAYLPDQNLRLGTSYNPWEPATHFKFPDDDGSFARAALRCVGVGKCRRTSDAFMCPSFLATREEKDTTRGRARLLFEMFQRDLIDKGWKSKDILKSLELCLGCKGCKVECPVNVDMATYKSEFLSHYYHHRLRPRAAYAMGMVGTWAKLGSRMPRTANLLSQTVVFRNIAKALAGVSQKRKIPKFAHRTFSDWFRHRPEADQDSRQRVVLFPDVFNDIFFPKTLEAAVTILEHWGYQVLLPNGRVSAVRPLIHYGMLDRAERALKKTIRQLRPLVADGVPVIVLEPSTGAVFREELRSLFPNDQDGYRLGKATYLLSEFIEEKGLELPSLRGRAIFHGHCHQKAALNPASMRNVLRKIGLEFEEPQPGCCGMAGSFGLESAHYDVSMKIGEENLLPAVRDADEHTLIIADGFSCRSQIVDGTGKQPLHLSEVLSMALTQERVT